MIFAIVTLIALTPLALVVAITSRRIKSPVRRFSNFRNLPFCGEEPLRERVKALRNGEVKQLRAALDLLLIQYPQIPKDHIARTALGRSK